MRQTVTCALALFALVACGDDDVSNPIVLEPTVVADTIPHAVIDVRTPPPYVTGDTVLLDGSASRPTDASLSFAWSLFSTPDGSSSEILQTPADPLAEVTGDVAGEFIVQLTVSNESGDDATFALLSFAPPPTCVSNSDCPAPASVCDTTRGICVECLVLSDCAHQPSTVCDQGTCACPNGDWCAPDLCVDLDSDPDHCGRCNRACYGSCVAGGCADPWEPTSMDGAPTPRYDHAAVWAEELGVMVVWGGNTDAGATNTGGVYDPATSNWHPTNVVNAPTPRYRATAVWTGTEMIVWGGQDNLGGHLATGGRYDVSGNTWTRVTTTGAPVARVNHTAVWTGTEMVVWGGTDGIDQLTSGGRYNPAADSWTSTAATVTSRAEHTAVWSTADSRMLIYGGRGDPPAVEDVYLPSSGAPGGESYDPSGNSWQDLIQAGQPAARARHTAVYDGASMIVWGGFNGSDYLDSGARYTASSWAALAGTPPEGRAYHTAVWIAGAQRMVIWGGSSASHAYLHTGAEYSTETHSWLGPTPTAPQGRHNHTAVSTGSTMIIWGGKAMGGGRLAEGAIYTP